MLGRIVRIDKDGVTHWTWPPPIREFDRFGPNETCALCDNRIALRGTVLTVDQSGPTCLRCIVDPNGR